MTDIYDPEFIIRSLRADLQTWKARYAAQKEQAFLCFCIGLFGVLVGVGLAVISSYYHG